MINRSLELQPKARKKSILLLVTLVCLLLNLYTMIVAYAETKTIDAGCCTTNKLLAKDFSAYYVSAWQLFHDPTNVYNAELAKDGGPVILPHPEAFKYLPSFLLFIVPLVPLDYQSALTAFDIFQFLLLPLIGFLIYKLLDGKNTLAIAIVLVISLLQPSPTPHWGFSISYFWQWAEGQNKVLNTFLLLFSFYLGQIRKPIASGAVLALGSFDLRFLLLSIPLFVVCNREIGVKKATIAFALGFALLNIPLFALGMGPGFLGMVVNFGFATPLFYYGYISLLTILSLTLIRWRDVYEVFSGAPKTVSV